ncbi:hypothetical protein BDQ17DRAFT_1422297 [Cyathus striatus]|nr:hypothetical protein BDQ17DRAFT_1422297 [Cyathus striatus]
MAARRVPAAVPEVFRQLKGKKRFLPGESVRPFRSFLLALFSFNLHPFFFAQNAGMYVPYIANYTHAHTPWDPRFEFSGYLDCGSIVLVGCSVGTDSSC